MSVLPKGRQWKAHDKVNGQAARRRIRQRFARHVAVCDSCETEHPLARLRACRTDPDGNLLLVDDLTLGDETRLVCVACLASITETDEPGPQPPTIDEASQ
jgi:hypothetical protein